ncbi:MAG: hypothetical protein U9P49_08535 [Thermodesulfobacteriota bacterium]|nr:hypothetical protein [Thermodesulfobacteriota bacterium]
MLSQVSGLEYSGSIILKDQIPSIFVGRQVVATVLSQPRGGSVMVSLFGRRLIVETTMDLLKGQVLNLRVHAIHPKIVLKPVDNPDISVRTQKAVNSLVQRFVGTMGKVPLGAFKMEEIIRHVLSKATHDTEAYKLILSLLEEASKFPQALAFLFIPVVDKDSRGNARVVIEEDGKEGYTLNFWIDTDHIGSIHCIARLCDGIEVEIMSNLEDVADLLRSYLGELADRLDSLGINIKRLYVAHKNFPVSDTGLDMIV